MTVKIGRYKQKKQGAPRNGMTRCVWCPLCLMKHCACTSSTLERVNRELRRAITAPFEPEHAQPVIVKDEAVEEAFRKAVG